MAFRGFFDDNNKNDNNNNFLICPIHGEYPASMKAFGCPECAKEEEDEENEEEMLDKSKLARFKQPRKK